MQGGKVADIASLGCVRGFELFCRATMPSSGLRIPSVAVTGIIAKIIMV
jgi:hypothetical protein